MKITCSSDFTSILSVNDIFFNSLTMTRVKMEMENRKKDVKIFDYAKINEMAMKNQKKK